MALGTSAGSRLFIGTTTRMATLTAYKADTWVEVGMIETLGYHGDEAADVSFKPLASRRAMHFKGSYDAGNMPVTCGSDPADPGQMAMTAAFGSDLDFNFKITENDQLTLSGTPTTEYFYGKVMSKRKTIGATDNVVRQNFNIGINSEILEDPAT
jgi:hypothetical protein